MHIQSITDLRQKHTFPAGILTLLLTLLIASPAQAFRCGNDLISEGDRKYEVLAKCGEPDFRDRHATAYLPAIGPVGIREQWYYDPGPNGLVRILTFRQGRLRSIETNGRGFGTKHSDRDCDAYALRVGMSIYELLSRCGEPVARDAWLDHFPPPVDGRRLRGLVRVEEWTYSFGPNQFRRFVRIVNGKVAAIDVGDRGE